MLHHTVGITKRLNVPLFWLINFKVMIPFNLKGSVMEPFM